MIRSRKHNRGFTLIELLVCITIFVIMTALLVVKYGNFNQSVLATNLAYDTALAMRTAQTYGLSVKGAKTDSGTVFDCSDGSTADPAFQCSYGVEFDTSKGGQFILFIHYSNPASDGSYNDGTDQILNTYTMKSGSKVAGVCAGSDTCTPIAGKVDVFFKRPDPQAIICDSPVCTSPRAYARITIQTPDGNSRSVSVRSNGQISVDI